MAWSRKGTCDTKTPGALKTDVNFTKASLLGNQSSQDFKNCSAAYKQTDITIGINCFENLFLS